jgi:hypothetical protein
VLLAVVVGASGIGIVARDLWAAGGREDAKAGQVEPPAAQALPRGGAQPDPKKEIAVLRQEIAELRGELATALKEIKRLKDALRQAGALPEEEPLYRGKPARFWIEQLKDNDSGFRETAVQALGTLATQNHDLVPHLMTALRDPSERVRHESILALERLSASVDDIAAKLFQVLREDTSAQARAGAARILGNIGGADIVAPLTEALKDKDGVVVVSAAKAMVRAGAAAKSAIPRLIEAFDKSVQSLRIEMKTGHVHFNNVAGGNPSYILVALLRIEPELAKALPGEMSRGVDGPMAGVSPRIYILADELPLWRNAAEVLTKRYRVETPKQ